MSASPMPELTMYVDHTDAKEYNPVNNHWKSSFL